MLYVSLALTGATALALVFVFSRPVWLRRWAGREIFLRQTSPTDLAVEFGFAFLIGAAAAVASGAPWLGPAAAAAAWLSVFASRTDLATLRIPKEPCWVVFAIGVMAALANFSLPHAIVAVVALTFVAVVFLLTALLSRGALGSGDVRLVLALTPLTYWLGITPLLAGLLLAAALQLLLRAAQALPRHGASYPFAPALALGILLGFAWAAPTAAVTPLPI